MVSQALLGTKLCEPCRVGTVLAADDQHEVNLAGKIYGSGLSLICRRTDGSQDPDVPRLLKKAHDNLTESRSGKRRLAHDAEFAAGLDGLCFILCLDDLCLSRRPFKDALDLRMFLLSDDDHTVPFIHELLGGELRLLDVRTCRVHDLKAARLRLVVDRGAHAVRADDDGPLLHLLEAVYRTDAFAAQPVNHLRVVDDGAERTGSPVSRSILSGNLDGALDAIAKAKIIC